MAASNMKDVKRRIKSVESTMQITKAMQLVASSKLRRAKERAEAVQPFFALLFKTMCDISRDHVLNSVFTKAGKGDTILLVVIAGDRGLAGGFNSNVLKMAKAKADDIISRGKKPSIMAIGKKAVEYFEKRDYELAYKFPHIAENFDGEQAKDIGEEIAANYSSGELGGVDLIYTTFVSAMTQEACLIKMLPVENLDKLGGPHLTTEYDPSPEVVFNGLVPQYISGMVYSAVVDSYASEQAARRSAMESASDNAQEMIDNLSLLYNRARQAVITQEITEISSAALGGENDF